MRKALVIALASVYLLVSSGVVVNMHYCMGKLATLGIGHHDSKTCEKCGMDNNGCCKDEVRVVKIQDNQESSAGFTAVPKIEATPVARPIEGSSGSYTKGSSIMQFAHAPPPGYGHGFQAFYCVFRI